MNLTANYLLYDKIFSTLSLMHQMSDKKKKEDRESLYKNIMSRQFDIIRCMQELQFFSAGANNNNRNLTILLDAYVRASECTKNMLEEPDKEKKQALKDACLQLENAAKTCNTDWKNACWKGSFFYGIRHFLGILDIRVKDELSNKFNCLDAGGEYVRKVVNAAASFKTLNILFYNLAFWWDTVRDIKEEWKDGVNLYGTYALEDKTGSILTADFRKNFERVACGNPDKNIIQNRAFDLVAYRFTYDPCYHDGGVDGGLMKRSRIEKDIGRIKSYLSENGILLMTVPTFLLKSKEILALKNNFEYLWSIQLPLDPAVFVSPVHYVMIALRCHGKQETEMKEESFQKLQNLRPEAGLTDEMAEETVSKLSKKSSRKIRLMEGEYMDRGLLEIVLTESTIHDVIRQKEQQEIHPLLPLQKGQIGQILASGRLDGIIEEDETYKHVIRGRVYKGHRQYTETDFSDPQNASVTIHTLKNNMIEINLFAGDGTYKSVMMQGEGRE